MFYLLTYLFLSWNVQFIMEEMFFSGMPLLEAVGLREPFVVELRETIRQAILKAVLPMKAYAEQYESFLHVLNLDINTYIKFVFTLFTVHLFRCKFTICNLSSFFSSFSFCGFRRVELATGWHSLCECRCLS